jgi:mono/diheme cytochrome c family protein
MKAPFAVLAAFLGATAAGPLSAAGQATVSSTPTNSTTGTSTRSIWDGVYTAEQADRGKVTFDRACARCHGADLRGAGKIELSLAGPTFASRWNGRPLSDLYLKVGREQGDQTKTMMRPMEINETLAYILSANGFPAGQTALSQVFSDLEQITLLARPLRGTAKY